MNSPEGQLLFKLGAELVRAQAKLYGLIGHAPSSREANESRFDEILMQKYERDRENGAIGNGVDDGKVGQT